MNHRQLLIVFAVCSIALTLTGCGGKTTSSEPGTVLDEAKQAGRTAESFPAADEDYFREMDKGVTLTPDEVKGRNMWLVWTGGNVSGRVPGADLFVIKPSGVSYDDLAPENMILCDLDGNVIEGTPGADRSPSSDTAAHAYVYRNMPDVGGVVHTHSTYAVAWAARADGEVAALAPEASLQDP